MSLRLGIAAAILMMSGTVFSAVTILAPEEIKIVAVNDQEIKTGMFRSNSDYKIDAGSNKISVRYVEYFQHHDNSHDILKSGVVTLVTPNLQDGQEYRLTLMNAPKNFDEAQKYKNQPVIGLYDAKNQLITQQIGITESARPWFSTNFSTKSVDLTTQPKSKIRTTVQAGQMIDKTSPQKMSADQALVQEWQKANKEERQKFMSWLAEQAN